jgi:transitional endoplasmic reticulum ATPase
METGPRADLARVTLVGDGGRLVYLDYRNGQSGNIHADVDLGLATGEVVFVRESSIERAPDELWPEEQWVGVVRLCLGDKCVVNINGNNRLVECTLIECAVDNTVAGTITRGVEAVLDEKPVRLLDLPGIDETVIEGFRVPRSGDLSFDDFGGLRQVVERAYELIELPLKHHEALERIGARPIKGVLFTGDPGTGKTMLAKIIANEASAAFYEISGPEVFSKWYGASEELLRKIFTDAAKQERSIIFFDELDSVAAQRDNEGHEASKRVVAQLLTLMDGFNRGDNVVVIAATNRPDDIDVALRRPGRFDWEIEFPLPSPSDRVEILRTSAARLATTADLPHEQIARMTGGWSAAMLTAIWSEAALLAVADERDRINREDYVGGYERVAEQRQRLPV